MQSRPPLQALMNNHSIRQIIWWNDEETRLEEKREESLAVLKHTPSDAGVQTLSRKHCWLLERSVGEQCPAQRGSVSLKPQESKGHLELLHASTITNTSCPVCTNTLRASHVNVAVDMNVWRCTTQSTFNLYRPLSRSLCTEEDTKRKLCSGTGKTDPAFASSKSCMHSLKWL